jgi:hypothetical protein
VKYNKLLRISKAKGEEKKSLREKEGCFCVERLMGMGCTALLRLCLFLPRLAFQVLRR